MKDTLIEDALKDYTERQRCKKKTEPFNFVPTHYQDKGPIQYYVVKALCMVGGIFIILFGLAVVFGLVVKIINW